MMDLSNREIMGDYFHNHPDSNQFPLVADLFLMDGETPGAEEICKIGLNHHPDHPDGLFVLAQIQNENKDFKKAEGTLKRLLKTHTVYPEALTLLAEIQEKINRSPNTVKAVRKNYERFNFKSAHQKRKKITKKQNSTTRKKTAQSVSTSELKPLKISSKLATFTLVEILENQGLYPQAIDILDILEEKNQDKKRVIKTRNRILKKFHSSN